MDVTFEKVTPGVALGAADANKLKREIGTYVEGLINVPKNTDVNFPDFKDSDGRKRLVQFKILRTEGQNVFVELKTFRRLPID
jgi:hypothetical protein